MNPPAPRHQPSGYQPAIRRLRPWHPRHQLTMRLQCLRLPANYFQRPCASTTDPPAPRRPQHPRLQPASLLSSPRDQRVPHRPHCARVPGLWFHSNLAAVPRPHPAPSLVCAQRPPTSPGGWSRRSSQFRRSSCPGPSPWRCRSPRLSQHRLFCAYRQGLQRAACPSSTSPARARRCSRRHRPRRARRPKNAYAGDSWTSRPWRRAFPTGPARRPSVGLCLNRHSAGSPTDRAPRSPHRGRRSSYRSPENPRDPALRPGLGVVRPCGGGFRLRARPTDPAVRARRHECRRPRRSDPCATARRRLRQWFAERRKSCPVGDGSPPLQCRRTSQHGPAA
jgi:hypothetical protein